jgi:hypothetical protein
MTDNDVVVEKYGDTGFWRATLWESPTVMHMTYVSAETKEDAILAAQKALEGIKESNRKALERTEEETK